MMMMGGQELNKPAGFEAAKQRDEAQMSCLNAEFSLHCSENKWLSLLPAPLPQMLSVCMA